LDNSRKTLGQVISDDGCLNQFSGIDSDAPESEIDLEAIELETDPYANSPTKFTYQNRTTASGRPSASFRIKPCKREQKLKIR